MADHLDGSVFLVDDDARQFGVVNNIDTIHVYRKRSLVTNNKKYQIMLHEQTTESELESIVWSLKDSGKLENRTIYAQF